MHKRHKILNKLLRDDTGGIAVYVAFFAVLMVGAGALSLDFGRMAVLRTQMQNRADAGAMAGALQLDGRDGAQDRAADVAMNAMSDISKIASNGTGLSVQGINFYSEWDPAPVPATGDSDSQFIEVVLQPKTVDLVLFPVLGKLTGDNTQEKILNAAAVAGANPFICNAPPLMICDPFETDPTQNLADEANIGRQIALKPPPSGGFWAPGNYGLLALPDGSIGADVLKDALAAVTPPACYSLDVGTAPGVKTNKIQDGINARFDLPGSPPYPAPNVINFPQDVEVIGGTVGVMGSGNWDLDGYWLAKHGTLPPSALNDASRYQAYLYELGETFGRSGKKTIYPVDGALPGGYTLVTPSSEDIPVNATYPNDPNYDGEPSQTVASNGYARRLVKVAVLNCVGEGVKGAHTYPTEGNYLEMFITQAVPDAPAGAIYGEIVRPLNPDNDPDFHGNVQLVK